MDTSKNWLNQQQPLKQSKDIVLKVHSIFRTIQGEGIFAGHRAVFVRLYGCNLQCPFCDTDYTSTYEDLTPYQITTRIRLQFGEVMRHDTLAGKLVVITGGEPLRQDISDLVNMLLSVNAIVQIETNGTLFNPKIEWQDKNLYVVCSPKTGTVNKELKDHIAAYKYVIDHESICSDTGLPTNALGHPCSKKINFIDPEGDIKIFVQPADMQDEEYNRRNLDACMDLVYKYGFVLSLQTHKIIGVQ